MTTETTMEKDTTTTSTHWAAELGRQVAARRAERQAEREAEAQAEGTRAALPAAELRRLFAATVNHVLAAVGAFAQAGGVSIEAAPPAATCVELRAGGDELLRLQLQDDTLRVTLRSRSYGTEEGISLTNDFSPETTARQIAEQYIRQISAAMEAIHGTR